MDDDPVPATYRLRQRRVVRPQIDSSNAESRLDAIAAKISWARMMGRIHAHIGKKLSLAFNSLK
jgi:hypothetical protein